MVYHRTFTVCRLVLLVLPYYEATTTVPTSTTIPVRYDTPTLPYSFTMVKFAAVLALLVSGVSAFVSQNGAAKPSTALRAAEGVWDPMVCL